MNNWVRIPAKTRPKKFEFTINYKPDSPIMVEQECAGMYRINSLSLRIAALVKTTRISLSIAEYLGSTVAYGSAENIFCDTPNKKVILTMIQKDDQVKLGSILIPEFEGGEDGVLEMEFFEEGAEQDTS